MKSIPRILIMCVFGCWVVSTAVANQKIDDFYLSGFENKGEKNWEVKGTSALIEEDTVAIKDVEGYTYQQDNKINVKADKGAYNKQESSMELEDNVHIQSDDGMDLKTEKLAWDQKSNKIATDDKVYITKDKDMEVEGEGLHADTQMKTATLDKNVEVKFQRKNNEGFVMVTCDGPVEMNYSDGNIVFKNNVKMNDNEIEMAADIATMFFDQATKKIEKAIVEGNVKILRGKDITYAQKATYYDANKKIILEGSPKLIFFPEK